jgi:3-oxoacyl-[acyl-carrier-protein] synthase II
MPTPATAPVVLTGLAMATTGGIGRAFGDGAPRAGVVCDLEVRAEPVPTGPGRLADRPATMTIDTLEPLLDGAFDDCPPERRGLVLGSGSAGIDQSMTVTSDSLTRARPFNVNPALVPACVMNYASAQCAIRFDLRGPNVTVTAGRVTGLATLGYARRLLLRNRADLIVCGAFEDLNDRRAALHALRTPAAHASGPYAPSPRAPAEGCCAFLLETGRHAHDHGRPVLAEVVALDSRVVADPEDESRILAATLTRVLTGIDPAEVTLAVSSGTAERHLRPFLPNAVWTSPADVLGDTLGATAAFDLAVAALSRARLAAVICADPDGQVACAVLRSGAQ